MEKINERKEYSVDGGTWTKKPLGFDAYERYILDFERGWPKERIKGYFTLNSKIEYSTDDSYSWVPFRPSPDPDENAARIFTMLQRDYQVRRIVTRQIGQPQMTMQSAQSSGSFFRAANVANGNSKPVKIQHKEVHVYRREGGQYAFTEVGLDALLSGLRDAVVICTVNQKTVFNMETPNENTVTYTKDGEVRNKNQMRVRGFVFRFLETKDVPSIEHWWPVLRTTNHTIDPNDFVVVKSARLWDDEMDQFFDGLGPIVNVMGSKYILSWRSRNKFGDTWLLPKHFQKMAEDRIRAKGGFIETPTLSHQLLEAEASKPQSYTAEVSPEYIMGIKDSFKEIVASGSDQQIMDNLIKVVDFRNKCVDELKELNKIIEEARLKVRENANG